MSDRNVHEIIHVLKEIKKRNKLTNVYLAQKTQLDRATITKLFKDANRKQGPSYVNIEKVANAMGYELSDLLIKDDSTAVHLDSAELERRRKYKALSPEAQRTIDEILDMYYERDVNSIKKKSK